MKNFKLNCSLFLIIISNAILSWNSALASSWDWEYWQYFNWTNLKCGPYKIYTIGELRLNKDISRFYYYRLTANSAYQALSWLDLEAHYSFIYNKSRGSQHFTYASRLEFEANPILRLDHGITLKWRNRFEFLRRQHNSKIQYILRHRMEATFPVKCFGRLTSIKCSDEFFYNVATNKFTQNRFIPIEMSFVLNSKISIDIFIMLRNFYSLSSDKWFRSMVFGSELKF